MADPSTYHRIYKSKIVLKYSLRFTCCDRKKKDKNFIILKAKTFRRKNNQLSYETKKKEREKIKIKTIFWS